MSVRRHLSPGVGPLAAWAWLLLVMVTLASSFRLPSDSAPAGPVRAAAGQTDPNWDRFVEVDAIGGQIAVMHTHEGRLLVGRGQALEVLDPNRPDLPLGRSAPLGGQIVAIEARGQRVYVGTSLPAALITLDLRDPGRPREIGRIDLGPGQDRFSQYVVDLELIGSRLFAAPQFGLWRFEMDGHGLPVRGELGIPTAQAQQLARIHDRLLFATQGHDYLTFDASSPAPLRPSLVLDFEDGDTMALAGDIRTGWLYRLVGSPSGSSSIWLESYPIAADRLGPIHHRMRLLGLWSLLRPRLIVAGGRLFASLDEIGVLASISLDDPAAPSGLQLMHLRDGPSDLALVDGRLFMSTFQGELAEIGFDATDAGGAVARQWPVPRPDLGLATSGDLAVVATRSGLMTLSLSKNGSLRPLAIHEVPSWGQVPSMQVTDLQVDGRLAYLLYRHDPSWGPGRSGLSLVDLADPKRPHPLGFFETPDVPSGLAIGDQLALLWNGDGFRLIDLADATRLREVGAYRSAERLQALAVDADIAYLGIEGGRLDMVSLADPNRPELLVHHRPSSAGNGTWTALRHRGTELFALRQGDPALLRFVLEDPFRIQRRGAIPSGFFALDDLELQGERLFFEIQQIEIGGMRSRSVPGSVLVAIDPGGELRQIDDRLPFGPPVPLEDFALASGRHGELLVLRGLRRAVYLPALLRGCDGPPGCDGPVESNPEARARSDGFDRR